MNIGKVSGLVTEAPRALFADSCSKEVAKLGMSLITPYMSLYGYCILPISYVAVLLV